MRIERKDIEESKKKKYESALPPEAEVKCRAMQAAIHKAYDELDGQELQDEIARIKGA